MSKTEAPKTPFKAPTHVAQWLVLLGVLPLSIALSYFVGEARGWVIGAAIAIFALYILLAWPLRKEGWFWGVAAVLAAAHIAAILDLDWSWVTTQRSGFKLLGSLAMPDVSLMYATTYGVYRLKYGTPAQSIEPSIDDLPSYGDRNLDF